MAKKANGDGTANVSQQSLLRAIKELERGRTVGQKESEAVYLACRDRLEAFKKENEEYVRLSEAYNAAREEYYSRDHKENERKRESIRSVRAAVLTQGATAETVKMVEGLALVFPAADS